MNIENLSIYDRDLELAHSICNTITDEDIRNKAVANAVAPAIASRFFDRDEYKIDVASGLHNISAILQDFDISDLYINDKYIDVRLYFNDDELSVPVSQFEKDILPVVYMFIKVTADLSSAVVTGFIRPENVDRSNEIDGYYPVDLQSLNSFYDIESCFSSATDYEDIDNVSIYEFIEGTIDNKFEIFRKLLKSEDSRLKLKKAFYAESVFNLVSFKKDEIGNDVINTEDSNVSEDIPDSDESAAIINESQNLSVDEAEELTEADLDGFFEDNTIENGHNGYPTEVTPSGAEVIESLNNDEVENEEQIDTLFNESESRVSSAPRKRGFFGFIILLALIGAIGYGAYFVYANYFSGSQTEDVAAEMSESTQPDEETPAVDAMPVETVDSKPVNAESKEEANPVAIPAIEQNLDASIIVSNLKTEWEVPAGYAANTSAKRYLVKLGRVVQLNLKTELLLLSRPPITNKIAVEIQFNKNSQKFETVGIVTSSGEKVVDDLILKTVSKVLNMNLSANTDSFGKLQGNPVLIIHL